MGMGPLCKCLLCQDEIQSIHVHDLVTCKCGKSFVDGGDRYLRCGGYISVIEEQPWGNLNTQ